MSKMRMKSCPSMGKRMPKVKARDVNRTKYF